MSVYRIKKRNNYTALLNKPFQDKKMSLEARGLLAYLLTKPDDWEVMNRDLYRCSPAGRHKTDRIIRELRDFGYIKRFQERLPDGKFTWVSEVYEKPQDIFTIPPLSDVGLSDVGLSDVGLSDDGKRGYILSNEAISNEALNKKPLTDDLLSPEAQNNDPPSSGSDEPAQSEPPPIQEKEKPPQKKKAAMRKDPPTEKKLGSSDPPEMRPIDSAFGIFQRLAEIDPSISSKRGQVLRDAKALLNGNNGRAIPAYSPQDILDCARFIIQDPWRIKNMVPLTSQTLIERLPKWIAAKRPSTWAEWQSKAPSGNAADDQLYELYRDKTDDPEAQEEPLFG